MSIDRQIREELQRIKDRENQYLIDLEEQQIIDEQRHWVNGIRYNSVHLDETHGYVRSRPRTATTEETKLVHWIADVLALAKEKGFTKPRDDSTFAEFYVTIDDEIFEVHIWDTGSMLCKVYRLTFNSRVEILDIQSNGHNWWEDVNGEGRPCLNEVHTGRKVLGWIEKKMQEVKT